MIVCVEIEDPIVGSLLLAICDLGISYYEEDYFANKAKIVGSKGKSSAMALR